MSVAPRHSVSNYSLMDNPQSIRNAANPAKGFYSPYFLFIPAQISRDPKFRLRFIVMPNNSGFVSDDPGALEKDALKTICGWRRRAMTLGVAALVPAFPRAKDVYTNSLSRAAMTTTVPTLHRPDLQLITMIDDAVAREAKAGLRFERRVLMFGFSASAMFTNRFVFLHPDRVLAAAYGSPGGWALAPVPSWHGAFLPYPVGIGDIKALTGKPFHLKTVARIPQFLFLGTPIQTMPSCTLTHSTRKRVVDLRQIRCNAYGSVALYGAALREISAKCDTEALSRHTT